MLLHTKFLNILTIILLCVVLTAHSHVLIFLPIPVTGIYSYCYEQVDDQQIDYYAEIWFLNEDGDHTPYVVYLNGVDKDIVPKEKFESLLNEVAYNLNISLGKKSAATTEEVIQRYKTIFSELLDKYRIHYMVFRMYEGKLKKVKQ